MSLWLPRSQQQQAIVLLSSRNRALLHTLAFRRRPATAIARSSAFLVARRSNDSRNVPRANQNPLPPAPKEDAPLLTRAWKKVKHEAQHYWHGSKLLVSEVRISARLQWKILHGESLTRRERRQLKRTTQDLLRLVPFAVFVIVPFMELLLPEEKQRKLLRVRLEMAKFLQETLRESGLRANAHIVGSDAFKEFFRKVHVINVAKLFDDDLTLDNLSRPQLVSMCRYMCINAFGTDNFLRGAIRSRLRNLRRDDQAIDAEGVDSLSVAELQAPVSQRAFVPPECLQRDSATELSTWINLHLHNRVSGVLLILGRAFHFDRKSGEDEDGKTAVIQSLESVLSGLPDNLLNEAELEVDSDKASYKQKLEVLQQQEELIEDEEEQEQKEEDARRAKRESQEQEIRTAHSLLPDTELHPEVTPTTTENARMTTEQLNELGEALCVLSAKSSVLKERDELRTLMEENLQGDEDPKSPSGALTKRIRTMLTKIDAQLQEYDSRVGSSLQMISADAQGRISVEDLQKALTVIKHRPDDEVIQAVIQKLDVDQDGYVELEHVLGLIKEEGLGIEVDDEARTIIVQGKEIKMDSKPRKEDIVQE
ncbi:LETM1-like protein-domain-containing protein [Pisolithus albus]|nr:LETM1-like protein-domain-containing protein [Pisolithus albus]